MPAKPRWIARFAAFAIPRCRDLRLPPKPDEQVPVFAVFGVEQGIRPQIPSTILCPYTWLEYANAQTNVHPFQRGRGFGLSPSCMAPDQNEVSRSPPPPVYASSGHLLFGTPDGVLMAVPIDPATAELTGFALPVAEDLALSESGLASYAVSESGTLIYAIGSSTELRLFEPVWVTRSGDAELVDPSWRFDVRPDNHALRLAPDGEQVALVAELDGNLDIWIKHLPNGPFERLTSDDEREVRPAWSPDGQFVSYSKEPSGASADLWQSRPDGTGGPELLVDHDEERSVYQAQWSPDGEWLVFRTGASAVQGLGLRDIRAFHLGVDSAAIPLIATAAFGEFDPALSPDGRWLAYSSNQTGRNEVYVSPFPNVDASRLTVSTSGGQSPLWAHSGSELFFVDADGRLVAAEVETAPEFRVLERETLFSFTSEYVSHDGTHFYDITPDDQRFLLGRLVRQDTSGGLWPGGLQGRRRPDLCGFTNSLREEVVEKEGAGRGATA